MALHHRLPSGPLQSFINSLFLFEGCPPSHAKERVLPDGCAQLIINLHEDRTSVYNRHHPDDRQTFNGVLIVGPQTEFCIIDPAELTCVAGVHFKPGGAFAFLELPIDELHGAHVPLDGLWGNLAGELRERMLEADSIEGKLLELERALLAIFSKSRSFAKSQPLYPAVRFALDRFTADSRARTVGNVVEETGFSQRYFIDMFRREVGLTPKLFCRVRRFQRALQRIAAEREVDWASLALECGYFDQAHFIHDFRAFSGINPTTYLQSRPYHPNHVPIRPGEEVNSLQSL
ncbi:MAG: helix-turn-helix domain-containing protein [Acidobacteriota bacterium]|nr:helix-turn-helix domain-containing protein [Acidobacteriota bacterium]